MYNSIFQCLLGSSYIPHVTGSETIRWNDEVRPSEIGINKA